MPQNKTGDAMEMAHRHRSWLNDFRECQRCALEDESAARTVTVTFVPFVKWPSSPTARITYVPGSLKCTVVVALPVRSVPAGLIDVVIGSNVTLPGPR